MGESGRESARYAAVAVDVSLAHLDRPFDYAIPEAMAEAVVPGCRVKVRFAGRLCDGFVLALSDTTEHDRIQPLHAVVSSEPVLTPTVAGLVRAVADHYLGSFADVVRLAVPTRHATTEKATPRTRSSQRPELSGDPGPFGVCRGGPEFLAALGRGERPRAAWQPVPTGAPAGDWAAGFALAAATTLAHGRGALAVVPDARDVERLAAACTKTVGADRFVTLTADLGPSARYRAFLAALRGDVSLVIGTRAAAFAPVRDLGLVALWDDGDDLLAEPRAPYPHAREVLALRASREQAAVLFAGYGRTAEIAHLTERDWLRDLIADRETVRRLAPRTRIAADHDRALDRDLAARQARLPREVFEVIRVGLTAGPVLLQVPRAGYLAGLVCQTCREPVRCPRCHGPAQAEGRRPAGGPGDPPDHGALVRCRWQEHPILGWRCPQCGDRRWRAPVVGAVRTAEELGLAFPNTPVLRSSGERVLTAGPDTPALVVATPGAEPPTPGGYAAGVLLDAGLLVQRIDLRAGEEALRRWLAVTALVRPGVEGGTVIAVGPPQSVPLQAWLRVDPVGAAVRELADRRAAGFPPATRLIAIEGPHEAVAAMRDGILERRPATPTTPATSGIAVQPSLLGGGAPTPGAPAPGAPTPGAPTLGSAASDPDPVAPAGVVELGPVPIEAPVHAEEEWSRLSLIADPDHAAELAAAVRSASARRSALKSAAAVRIRVDPARIG